jgi:hypothetical protein
MSTQIASDVRPVGLGRSWRARVVAALGPLTVGAGAGWAVLQPYRITFLDPHGQGFWWLFVQPPLLVVLVGVLFHLVVAQGVLEDLESAGEEEVL